MQNVFYSILPIFLIALLGSIIRRKWLRADEFWRGLEKLSFYVLFPAMIFQYTAKVDLSNAEFTKTLVVLMISHIVTAIILVIYQIKTEYNNIQFTSVFQGATRYNNYIFFAVGSALLGEAGLKMIATISPYMLILTNVTSIISFIYYIPKSDSNLNLQNSIKVLFKSMIGNPIVVSSILGMLFNYSQLELNLGVKKTINILANAALSVGILIVGAGMQFTIKQKYLKQVMFTSAMKLICMPIITYVILTIIGLDNISKSVAVLFSCLPCASSSYILSRQLGGDPESMSSIITFTTIFSMFSLWILVYILA